MKQFFTAFLLFWAAFLSAATAPDFTVTTSDGQQRRLYADYVNQQKLVVIEAFFTTCPPCNAHAPYWQALYQSMLAAHPGKVEFLMLSTQNFDKNANVATYKTNKGLTMPGAGQDGGSVAALAPYTNNQFGTFLGTPTFIVIAPGSGELSFDIRGTSAQQTMGLLTEKINQLLAVRCDIRDIFNAPIPDVSLQVDAPSFDTTMAVSGTYSLSNVAHLRNANYRLKPVKTDNPLNGISTLDLALISKHILGLEVFKCPWQLLAADINCNGSISTFDVVTGRKLILGILDTLPCGSWRFSSAGDTASKGNCVAFQGVKVGDVNAGPNCPVAEPIPADDRNRTVFSLYVEDQPLKKGVAYRIPLNAGGEGGLSAFQFRLQLAPQAAQLDRLEGAGYLTDFSGDMYHGGGRANDGLTSVVWYAGEAVSAKAHQPLLWLNLTATEDVALREVLRVVPLGLNPEWYDENGDAHPIELQWYTTNQRLAGVSIAPNPNAGVFWLGFSAEKEETTTIQVFDLQGKMVFEQPYSAHSGHNSFEIRLPEKRGGLYGVKANGRLVGKVLLLANP